MLIKILSIIVISIITIVFGFFPRVFKNSRLSKSTHNKILGLANAFSGGIFIGIAFFHLLPEASEAFRSYFKGLDPKNKFKNFPFQFCFAFVAYALILFIEKIAFDSHSLIDHEHKNDEQHGHDHPHDHSIVSSEKRKSIDNEFNNLKFGKEFVNEIKEESSHHSHNHSDIEQGHSHDQHQHNDEVSHDHNHDHSHMHDHENEHEHEHDYNKGSLEIIQENITKKEVEYLDNQGEGRLKKEVTYKKYTSFDKKDDIIPINLYEPLLFTPQVKLLKAQSFVRKTTEFDCLDYTFKKDFMKENALNGEKNTDDLFNLEGADSDEEEEIIRNIIGNKGKYMAFLQMRTIKGNIK